MLYLLCNWLGAHLKKENRDPVGSAIQYALEVFFPLEAI